MNRLDGAFSQRSRLAMTMVELMVAIGLGVIVSIGAISIFIMVLQGTAASIYFNQANQEAHLAVDAMTRDIRMASGVEESFAQGGAEYDRADDVLILKVPSIDENEDIIDIDNTFDRIVYFSETVEDEKVLFRTVLPNAQSSRKASEKKMGAGSFAIKPDALGAFVINYQFKPRKELRDKEYTMAVSGSVRLRNKK